MKTQTDNYFNTILNNLSTWHLLSNLYKWVKKYSFILTPIFFGITYLIYFYKERGMMRKNNIPDLFVEFDLGIIVDLGIYLLSTFLPFILTTWIVAFLLRDFISIYLKLIPTFLNPILIQRPKTKFLIIINKINIASAYFFSFLFLYFGSTFLVSLIMEEYEIEARFTNDFPAFIWYTFLYSGLIGAAIYLRKLPIFIGSRIKDGLLDFLVLLNAMWYISFLIITISSFLFFIDSYYYMIEEQQSKVLINQEQCTAVRRYNDTLICKTTTSESGDEIKIYNLSNIDSVEID